MQNSGSEVWNNDVSAKYFLANISWLNIFCWDISCRINGDKMWQRRPTGWIWQGLSIRENICAKASRKIWCLTRLLEGQRVPYKGVADPLGTPPQTPLGPSKIHLNPPKTIMDPRYHQYNPSSYHITHKILPISTEAPKMQKVSKKGRKCPKIKKSANCNNENWPIHIPCDIYFHFWWPK